MPLHAERATLDDGGNLQDRARQVRYALAEQHAEAFYAAGHTASDQAETVLYRLAVSPGSRALHGMPARRGRLVRPLLGVTRDEVRAYLRMRDLTWREDPSNADRRFARVRVRHELIEAMRSVGPAPERTIAETARQLREEAEVLDAAVAEALEELGGGPAVVLAALREHPPAVRRLVLRRLAGDRPVPDSLLDLGDRGTKSIDLGEGLRAVAEYGTLRFTRAREPDVPAPVELTVPGPGRFRRLGGRGRRWACPVRRRFGPRRWPPARSCGDGARATACAPSAWAGRRPCRTCSPTARSPASCGAPCRWWRRAARSCGWPAWR